jgi:hypothetical protein
MKFCTSIEPGVEERQVKIRVKDKRFAENPLDSLA